MAFTVNTDDLRGIIGRELGYSRYASEISANVTWRDDVESVLKDGLRRFYDPDILPGEIAKHQWSFLMPTTRFSFTEGDHRYDLPANFAMFSGPIHYPVASDTIWPAIQITSVEKIQGRLQQTTVSGRPYLAASRVKAVDEASNTGYELLVYPVPDQDYAVDFTYKINPVGPRPDESLPIGDQAHMQTIIEACLAAAEDFDGRAGVHMARYAERLRSSISHDRQVRSPHTLGYNPDRSDYYGGSTPDLRSLDNYAVSYNGVEYSDGP